MQDNNFVVDNLPRDLLDLITSSWKSQVIYVSAELKIADLLENGLRSSTELAEASNSHPPSLHRLLQAMCTIGLCYQRDDDLFELTPMGKLLSTNNPDSLRHWALWWGSNLWQAWSNLLYSIKTGHSARQLQTGLESFGHLENDPVGSEIFNKAMVELTRLTTRNIIDNYDFSGINTIMDVGGGYGQLLISILEKYPDMTAILFDLPHAIEGGRINLEQAKLAKRSTCIPGDFFDSVPAGADAFILKSVLHDWDDDKCMAILANCHRAMRNTDKLLLVERLLPDHLNTTVEHQTAIRTDLTMLVALGGRERSLQEISNMLDKTGFHLNQVVPVGMTFYVMEAVPSV